MQKIPQQKICELLSTVNGTFGIYVKNIDSDETFTLNADVVFPAASIIKIPLLAFLLKKVEDGSIDWNAPVDIAVSNRVGGTGILAQLDESYSPSVKSLA
ncbi:MAG: serine hydrolase, partial [Oscillospiraceae bacterium]